MSSMLEGKDWHGFIRSLTMDILLACEYSGQISNAFRAKGHRVISSDLVPRSNDPAHYCGDVRDILYRPWDMIIAHPPCTFLSKARGIADIERMKEAAMFFNLFVNHPCPKICIENPMPFRKAYDFIPRPNHWIDPTHFGYHKTKFTCLWLKGLPPLMPTVYFPRNEAKSLVYSTKGSKYRSKTPTPVALAMADQWG